MGDENNKNSKKTKIDWDYNTYFSAKKQKLIDQFEENRNIAGGSDSRLFKNIGIFVNGFTNPTAAELKIIMLKNGGEFYMYPDDRVTHIIATNLAHTKVASMRNKKVVRPEWIVDSLKANQILDTENYKLEVFTDKNQNKLNSYLNQTDKSAASNLDSSNLNISKNESGVAASSNQKARNIDAKDENFLSTFYGKSRLHLISTLATELKVYINNLRNSSDYILNKKPLPEEVYDRNQKIVLAKDEKVVFHLDMDCFFVSVSLRNKPQLQNQAVGIAHSKGKKANSKDDFSYSEIASCNYEARNYGLKNGMLVGTAKKLCPQLVLIDYDFDEYSKCSRHIYELVAQYTRQIKAVSCDEMLVDITDLIKESDGALNPLNLATFLRQQIRKDLDCPSSIGIGSNMLIARLATKKAKPNGQVWIRSGDESLNFISKIKISDLPGIGSSIMAKIHSKWDVNTCEELQKIKKTDLQNLFGAKMGEKLYEFCRGIDSRPFIENDLAVNSASGDNVVKKSISTDVNYGIRFESEDQVYDFFRRLSGELCDRLKRYNLKGTKLVLKLKIRDAKAPIETKKYMGCGLCIDKTVSTPIHNPTNDADVISNCVIGLYKQHYANCVDCKDLRGIGLQMDKLINANVVSQIKNDNFFKALQKINKPNKTFDEIINISDESNPTTSTDGDIHETTKTADPQQQNYGNDYLTFLEKVELFMPKNQYLNSYNEDHELDAIKRLLDDWIYWSSNLYKTDSIDDDDIQTLKGYLLYILDEEKIDKVLMILKLLKRLIITNGNQEWINRYKYLIDEIQTEFYQKYDAALEIDDENNNI